MLLKALGLACYKCDVVLTLSTYEGSVGKTTRFSALVDKLLRDWVDEPGPATPKKT